MSKDDTYFIHTPLEIEALPSTTYYIHVATINGLRMIDGCTQNLGYALKRWGLGHYYEVRADTMHDVAHEAQRLQYTDKISSDMLR